MQRMDAGFTLIELILIILIFTIVASGTISLIPTIRDFKQKIFLDELRFSLNSAIRYAKLRNQVIQVRCDNQSKEIVTSPVAHQQVVLHKLVIPSEINIQCPNRLMIDATRDFQIEANSREKEDENTFRVSNHIIKIDGRSAYVYQR